MIRRTIQINEVITLQQWEKVLLLLSLDRISLFWKEMGVPVPRSEGATDALRYFVTEQQNQILDDNLASYSRLILALINATMARIAAIEGDEYANSLLDWIENTYLPYLHRERWYETWHILFLRLAEGNISQLLEQGIPSDKLSALEALVTQWRETEAHMNARIEAADALPLVSWDAQCYAFYRRDSSDISPLDYLSSFLNNFTFAPFWEGLVELLSPFEISILNRWGQLFTMLKTSIPPAWAEIPQRYMESSFA